MVEERERADTGVRRIRVLRAKKQICGPGTRLKRGKDIEVRQG